MHCTPGVEDTLFRAYSIRMDSSKGQLSIQGYLPTRQRRNELASGLMTSRHFNAPDIHVTVKDNPNPSQVGQCGSTSAIPLKLTARQLQGTVGVFDVFMVMIKLYYYYPRPLLSTGIPTACFTRLLIEWVDQNRINYLSGAIEKKLKKSDPLRHFKACPLFFGSMLVIFKGTLT